MEISEIRDRVERREKDHIMPVYLPFLPAVLALVSTVLFIAGIFLGLGHSKFPFTGPKIMMDFPIAVPFAVVTGIVISIGALILGVYVLYKWIDRRNLHFKRVRLLYKDVLDFLEERGAEKDARRAKRTLREIESESDEKSPAIWIVLSIVFNPVVLYVFHFLTRDFFKHETRENFLLEDISDAIESAGGEFKFEEYGTIEDRNTILYIVLTIVTLGVFGFYWIYALTKDPNEHFQQSSRVEGALLDSLESL